MKRRLYLLAVTAISVLRPGLCHAAASQVLAVGLVVATAGVHAQTSMSAPSAPQKAARAAQKASLPLADATVERVLRESGELVLDHGDLPNLAMPA
jgi:Cu(I)/Ag(I) efflux system membrane protein CusA/SilA